MIRWSQRHSLVATAALAAAAMWLATAAAEADTRQVDSRWYTWIGCWAPLTADDIASTRDQVCVVPTESPSAVEVVTVAGESVVSRVRIDVAGTRRASQQDGCTGWEEMTWSSDGRRIYRRSESSCADGGTRSSAGLLAMTPKGEWLDVLAASVGNNSGVRVLRHRRLTSPSAVLPAEARAIVTEHAADIDVAWAAASAPIGTDAVIEAAHQVSVSVVQAWLSEVGPTFPVDARRLVELANAGVSGRVTDMLIALAYPDAFSVRSASLDASSSSSRSFPTSYGGSLAYTEYGAMLAGCRSLGNGSLQYEWPYMCAYGPYYGYARYGYGPYYGTWYSGNQPWEVVPGGGSGGGASSPSTTHGQVTKSGYVEQRGGDPGAASPRSEPAGSSSGSSDSSSGSSSGSSSTPSSSPSDGGRTAHPR